MQVPIQEIRLKGLSSCRGLCPPETCPSSSSQSGVHRTIISVVVLSLQCNGDKKCKSQTIVWILSCGPLDVYYHEDEDSGIYKAYVASEFFHVSIGKPYLKGEDGIVESCAT